MINNSEFSHFPCTRFSRELNKVRIMNQFSEFLGVIEMRGVFPTMTKREENWGTGTGGSQHPTGPAGLILGSTAPASSQSSALALQR